MKIPPSFDPKFRCTCKNANLAYQGQTAHPGVEADLHETCSNSECHLVSQHEDNDDRLQQPSVESKSCAKDGPPVVQQPFHIRQRWLLWRPQMCRQMGSQGFLRCRAMWLCPESPNRKGLCALFFALTSNEFRHQSHLYIDSDTFNQYPNSIKP